MSTTEVHNAGRYAFVGKVDMKLEASRNPAGYAAFRLTGGRSSGTG